MQNGIIVLNKPVKETSMNMVRKIKKKFNLKKVGHAGTLDPMAEGVLPILIGEATKFSDLLHESSKEYKFTVKFGIETNTMDSEGEVVEENNFVPSLIDIQNSLDKFKGKILQVPPKFSACKVDGKRAYDLARDNVDFTLNAKEIEINKLEIVDYESPYCTFICECSKGTYIRTLAVDIAKSINSICYVTKLIRTKHGSFEMKSSKVIEDISEQDFIPLEKVLWKNILDLNDEQYNYIKHGQKAKSSIVNGVYVGCFQGKIIGILDCLEGILSAKRMLK